MDTLRHESGDRNDEEDRDEDEDANTQRTEGV